MYVEFCIWNYNLKTNTLKLYNNVQVRILILTIKYNMPIAVYNAIAVYRFRGYSISFDSLTVRVSCLKDNF